MQITDSQQKLIRMYVIRRYSGMSLDYEDLIADVRFRFLTCNKIDHTDELGSTKFLQKCMPYWVADWMRKNAAHNVRRGTTRILYVSCIGDLAGSHDPTARTRARRVLQQAAKQSLTEHQQPVFNYMLDGAKVCDLRTLMPHLSGSALGTLVSKIRGRLRKHFANKGTTLSDIIDGSL